MNLRDLWYGNLDRIITVVMIVFIIGIVLYGFYEVGLLR